MTKGIRTTLSERKLQILRKVAEGKTNKDIAHELNIGEQTVKNHLSVVYAQFDVHNRVSAIIRLARQNIIK